MKTENELLEEIFPDRVYPNWIDAIAIDPTGEIYGFEGDAYWVDTEDGSGYWMIIDDGDGLRLTSLGFIEPIPVELSKQMYFRREPQEYDSETLFYVDMVDSINKGKLDFLIDEVDEIRDDRRDND